MAKRLEPANDLVLVADRPEGSILEGIELPDNVKQQEMICGVVVFVGRLVSPFTQPEDIVYYGPYAGKTVLVNGIELRLLREGQIEAYIREVPENG